MFAWNSTPGVSLSGLSGEGKASCMRVPYSHTSTIRPENVVGDTRPLSTSMSEYDGYPPLSRKNGMSILPSLSGIDSIGENS